MDQTTQTSQTETSDKPTETPDQTKEKKLIQQIGYAHYYDDDSMAVSLIADPEENKKYCVEFPMKTAFFSHKKRTSSILYNRLLVGFNGMKIHKEEWVHEPTFDSKGKKTRYVITARPCMNNDEAEEVTQVASQYIKLLVAAKAEKLKEQEDAAKEN